MGVYLNFLHKLMFTPIKKKGGVGKNSAISNFAQTLINCMPNKFANL